MNNPYIRSAFLFLLLLSLNGSPNSKLSRFFSSVVLFLFFFFPSRVCFVCSVYFHSTNSWDCFDFTDGIVWVCVRPGGYTRKRLFIIIARAPATATAAKRKRREEEKKKLFNVLDSGRATPACVLIPKWSCRCDIHHHVTSSLFILTALVFLLLLLPLPFFYVSI